MIITYLVAIVFIAIIGILFFGGKYKLKLRVKNLNNKESFIVEKKTNVSGNDFLDWFYFDERGKEIEDENVKKLIFEAFSEEDWYGDYEFYTKAESKVIEATHSH